MSIFSLVLAIFGLGNANLNQVRIAYARIVRFLIALFLPALIACYIMNIGASRWDWWPWLMYVPYLMGLIITAVFLMIAFSPEVLLGVGVANLLTKDSLWDKYRELLWLTVAWINIPFMYIGGVPAGVNPFAAFAIVVAITIFSAISEKSIWRRVVRFSAVIILMTNLLSLVGNPMWFWITGHTISIGPTKSDIQLQKIEKAKEDLDMREDVKFLEKIGNKLEKGEELSPSEKKFLKDMKERRGKNSLPEIIGEKLFEITWPKVPEIAQKSPRSSAPTTVQPRTSYVPAPAATTPAYTPPPAPPVPKKERYAVWFARNGQKMHQDVSITRDGAEITITSEGTQRTTVLEGTLESDGWYRGTMRGGGDGDGTFEINNILTNGSWFILNMSNGTVEQKSFTMTKQSS